MCATYMFLKVIQQIDFDNLIFFLVFLMWGVMCNLPFILEKTYWISDNFNFNCIKTNDRHAAYFSKGENTLDDIWHAGCAA